MLMILFLRGFNKSNSRLFYFTEAKNRLIYFSVHRVRGHFSDPQVICSN